MMDPSSIITQVKRPSEESLCPDSKEAQLTTVLHESHKAKGDDNGIPQPQADGSSSDSGVIIISVDDDRQRHSGAPRGRGGGSGSSRFLSQLFCCFGFGHTPDYGAAGYRAGAAEPPAAAASQQLHHHQQPVQLPPTSQALANGTVDDCGEEDEDQHHHQPGDEARRSLHGPLLPPPDALMTDRVCAVIDLDETLVHSSFRCSTGTPDFAIQVEVDTVVHQVYVLKRPFADEFLARMGQLFECVLFTASMAKYADPVSDLIDPSGAFRHRLFREACVLHCDSYVKDLATLGRPVDRCVIIDNSPASYMFNTENAIQVQTWMGDPHDTELRDLLPYMEQLAQAASVSDHLRCHPPPLQPPLSLAQVAAQMQQVIDEEEEEEEAGEEAVEYEG